MTQQTNDNCFPIEHALIESERFKKLYLSSKILLIHVIRLSNLNGQKNEGWFHQTLNSFAQATGFTANTIKKARQQLLEYDFIKTRTYKYKSSEKKKLTSNYKFNEMWNSV